MMNRDGNANLPSRGIQAPSFRSESSLVDPAVSSLFEAESALTRLKAVPAKRDEKEIKVRRSPSGRPRHYFIR